MDGTEAVVASLLGVDAAVVVRYQSVVLQSVQAFELAAQ